MAKAKRLNPRFTKSANVVRDNFSEALEGYIPTPKALELIERIVECLEVGRGGAFSVIGPYGAGKSSAALFVQALVGPCKEKLAEVATAKLRVTDKPLAGRLSRQLERLGVVKTGFIRAPIVAQRESVVNTVLRALKNGWAGHQYRTPRGLVTNLDTKPDPIRLLSSLEGNKLPPVMLVLDEFGKNLEHYVENPGQNDLFLLQQLAERANDSSCSPLFVLTLQHLAFEEYLSLSTPQAQREWAKVQGRFTDFGFSESPRQIRRLIAATLRATPETTKRLSQDAVQAHMDTIKELGLGQLLESSEAVSSTQPLHPIAVAVLPDLCSRYAQNERSLFAFLRSDERGSLNYLLRSTQQECSELLPIRLDGLYDYFVESARSQLMAARGARRWLEIESRIRDGSSKVDPSTLRVLKTVGVLNLISAGGALRASRLLVEYACVDDPRSSADRKRVAEALQTLESLGLVTFRTFANEFRIWSGSDFDLTAAFEQAYRQLSQQSLAATLQTIRPQAPVVAGKFSARTGAVRAFACYFVDDAMTLRTLQPSSNAYDGSVALWVGSEIPRTDAENTGPRPVVVAIPKDALAVRSVALEVAAYRQTLETNPKLKEDWVARRELVERLTIAEQHLDAILWSLFGADGSGVEYRCVTEIVGRLRGGRLSHQLSEIAEKVYHLTPNIANEVINREELSSQGAAARRALMEAMVVNQERADLALSGFGPEVAIYRALLKDSGIHREQDGLWTFGAPDDTSGLRPLWDVLLKTVKGSHFKRVSVLELFQRLSSPPYGVRQGSVPVVFTALALTHSDDLALYEHGAYQPVIAPDLIERLAKNPQNFEVRSFGLSQGGRQALVDAMKQQFRLQAPATTRRNTTVLSVVRPLLKVFRELPDYARTTRSLSERAIAVRHAFLTANEPDQLLFVALPQAVAFSPFAGSDSAKAASECAQAVAESLRELNSAFGNMTAELRRLGSDLLEVSLEDFRVALRVRASRLVEQAGHPALRSFLLRAQDEHQPDDDWFQSFAMSLSGKAPKSWRDDDVVACKSALRDRIGAVRRLEFLYPQAGADRASGTKPYRISLTDADGRERVLVGFDDPASLSLLAFAQKALADAIKAAGPAGGSGLVRSLMELLGQDSTELLEKA